MEGAVHVDGEHPAPDLGREVRERSARDDARVVDEDVDGSPLSDERVDGRRDRLRVRDVESDGERFAAVGMDRRGELAGVAHVDEADHRPRADESARDRGTNPPRRARDQGDLPRELHGLSLPEDEVRQPQSTRSGTKMTSTTTSDDREAEHPAFLHEIPDAALEDRADDVQHRAFRRRQQSEGQGQHHDDAEVHEVDAAAAGRPE